MRSLKVLCEGTEFPERQREWFRTETDSLLRESGTGILGTLSCLSRLWQYYDVGGHSMRRSIRSIILEKIQSWLSVDNGPINADRMRRAGTALSILVAMHYDYEYINRSGWFDYRLDDISFVPLRDRVLVSAAAFAFGVDDIPSMADWPKERILSLINEQEPL